MHHTCEVVFSKTYVKRKHDTFYKKLPSQPQKTGKAVQCLFWREVLEQVLVRKSDHTRTVLVQAAMLCVGYRDVRMYEPLVLCEHREWWVGDKIMQRSSDEPELLQEAMQCTTHAKWSLVKHT